MTLVSNDPSLWPLIDADRVSGYFAVACFTAMVYDWTVTFAQEFELIWVSKFPYQKNSVDVRQRQRWSLMTVLYLSNIVVYLPSVALTDAMKFNDYSSCNILGLERMWLSSLTYVLLGVIMITRLHAMYQRSRKMLIFLVVIFLAITIASGVIPWIQSSYFSGEEGVFSGTYQCFNMGERADDQLLGALTWIFG
ncbi:hypothetical protein K503DRAFT_860059, partial [Rhizopogon vinicolor AM-OR11-026]